MEVLTACALITILGVIAVPRLHEIGAPFVLRQTTQQIAAEFQKARMRAIARNARYRFTYNASTRVYSLEREATPGNFVAEYSNQLVTGITLGTISGTPTFDTRGMLASDVSIPVNVNASTTTRTVTINVLGKVTIS